MNVYSRLLVLTVFSALTTLSLADDLVIESVSGNGEISWTDNITNGLYRVEWLPSTTTNWRWDWGQLLRVPVTGGVMAVQVPMLYRVVHLPPIDEELIAYYPFNGNANDETGHGHDGTVSGASLTTDKYGRSAQAYYFDNIGYIQLPGAPLNNISNYTLSAWIYIDTPTQNMFVFWEGDSYPGAAKLMAYVDTNRAAVTWTWHDGCSAGVATTGQGVVPTNEWVFLAIRLTNGACSTGAFSIFVNTNRYDSNLRSPSGANIVSFLGRGFIGSIDDIRIWCRGLSDDEISYIYSHTP